MCVGLPASRRDLPQDQLRHECLLWVGTSSWQNGEAAVHRRLTLERQMNSTLLPDCAINTPAAEAEEFAFSLRSERPLRSETCLAASEAASVSSGSILPVRRTEKPPFTVARRANGR